MEAEAEDDKLKFSEIKKLFIIDKVKKQNLWTEEEDNQLLSLVQVYSNKNWKEVAKHFLNKTAIQCYSRYKQIKPGLKKGFWTDEEDEQVKMLVEKLGPKWSDIAKLIKNRNGKQVRDRYINYINPGTKHTEFTVDEDDIIRKLYIQHGSRWSYIAKFLENRTGDLVKNRFYSHIKKTVVINHKQSKRKFKAKLNKDNLYQYEQNNNNFNNINLIPGLRQNRKSPSSKFRPTDFPEELKIKSDDFYYSDRGQSDPPIENLKISNGNLETLEPEPEIEIINSIPSMPSSEKCSARVFDLDFLNPKYIDDIIKESENSIYSCSDNLSKKSSENRDNFSHGSSMYYQIENNPFEYSSGSNASSEDFDIKSQNYFI